MCLLLLMMILLSSPINVVLVESVLTTAKPGCQTSCGKVAIPFPFGIGANCSLDHWYAVNCSSNKPFLRSINLEVLNISIEEGTMLVNHPLISTARRRGRMESVNMENSPFFFSPTDNIFYGLGCDNFAYVWYNTSYIAGCYSSCRKSGSTYTEETIGCYGIKCCQTRIPSSLQVFNASVGPLNEITKASVAKKEDRKQAIFVQESWLSGLAGNLTEIAYGILSHAERVPVVLDWGIRNDSSFDWNMIDFFSYCHVFANISTSMDDSFANDNMSSSSTEIPVHKCKCSWGWEGNPYISGCQDIDECKDKMKKVCGPHMSCRNHIGHYECYSRWKLIITISVIGSGFFVLLLFIGAWRLHIIIKRRKDVKLKDKYFKRNGGLLLQQQLTSSDGNVDRSKLFNSKELDTATDHFNVNRILGQGGQGTVYKGMLADGKIIAVKKSKVIDEGRIEEFINEVAILSQINHRNVVKLLGCCLETEVPLLVYEFIPNGSLFQYLHDQNEELPFTWEMRLQIATEVAGALSYLHSAASLPIYHRDIKSANILLDDKYRAKIADFGTSRSITIDQTHVTTKVQGTFGYLDPEYFQSSQFTDKSDVYSFGVVLVELLTGKKPISSSTTQDTCRSLATYFLCMLDNNLFDILDAEVVKGKNEEIMIVANLAKRCLNLNGKQRPPMREVAMVLEGIRASKKESNVQQNHQEVEYVRTEAIEPWDVVSTSASSTFEITAPSRDTQPLLTM
ncbi:hypothetical protein JRO89_XS02G0255500 [Xanthoceras sorbifolium]|uniref:Protein kinase domain-containing protein n=1 Tax=Xanthoceras sorbifolium TaxID=99658 RepID=A0ABQ8IHG5_9ROSI|nr:hypothetical protein JRO89_XS02G0255500 [Xanthoceras sorbifolium]